uniref:Uncharacterized protein n=1 Tax=Lepeophtheirus salmonis TaxID=72036 RepID=A0A0K2TT01_LEPSM
MEYETMTPRRSLGSPDSAMEELAKFVSSVTLLRAASRARPLSHPHICDKGFIVKVRFIDAPGPKGHPSLVSKRATLQLY